MSTAAAPAPVDQVSLFTPERRREAARIVFVGILTLLYWQSVVPFPMLLIAIAIGLYPLARTGLLDLWHERKIGTELFVTIATTIALLGGEYVAAAVLMTIILIAEYIADLNTDRARASIKALVGATPRTATLRTPEGDRVVPIEELTAGAIVLVKAGEKIPVDGTVVAGAGAVNEAAITGESLPVDKEPDASVLAGTLVESGALDIRTDKVGPDTLFARIVALVEEAGSEAAPVQKLADRVATWLLPLVLVFLIVVFVLTQDIRKIVALLIFTSPAELGLATPMVMVAAIARAARHGILVKGGLYLERLAKVDAIVFDKTGTLTVGVPELVGIVVHDTALSEDDVLRTDGIKRFVMLTGDNAAAAQGVADAIGIDDVRAHLLPEDKITAITALQKEGYVVAMVGDGVNDAPALARADVGIAMGARGTQAAIEAADIALMTDDLRRIVTARLLARRAYLTIKENLFVGVGVVHVLGITAALMGWIGPIQAALLHLGPDVLVFLNSVKLLRVRIEGAT